MAVMGSQRGSYFHRNSCYLVYIGVIGNTLLSLKLLIVAYFAARDVDPHLLCLRRRAELRPLVSSPPQTIIPAREPRPFRRMVRGSMSLDTVDRISVTLECFSDVRRV